MSTTIGGLLSLRGLEVFDELSRAGSMQKAARNLGLSAPAASQQLKNLEAALGHSLVDHARRPLELSRAGQSFLTHVQAAMMHLRQGAAELSLIDLRTVRSLKLGIIDDFDGEVTPRLTVALANVLTPAELSLLTMPSLRIIEEVRALQLDIGIAARAQEAPEDLIETPLLRDPFVLAVPRGFLSGPPETIDALSQLAFLRYEKGQLLGRQIAAHLARLRLAPEGRIEIDSNQALFGLIAGGVGWAISTPVGFLRARRFHDQVDLFPLPFAAFSRTISLYHRQAWMPEIAGVIAENLRAILRAQIVEPGRTALPWIGSGLAIVPG